MRSLSLALFGLALGVAPLQAQAPCRPVPQGSSAGALLARAESVMQVGQIGTKVLHWSGTRETVENYMSDRTYPPFFTTTTIEDGWYRPATGGLRTTGKRYFMSYGIVDAQELLSGPTAVWMKRDSTVRAFPQLRATGDQMRALAPWALLRDWRTGPAVTVEGSCVYRDYPRTVVRRTIDGRTERLFLDPKTGFPVKLERRESHYLWGDVLVEYVWSNWLDAGGAMTPGSSFRMVDGELETGQVASKVSLLALDSAPSLQLPDPSLAQAPAPPGFLDPVMPDTVRIGPAAFLLVNRGYAEMVALRRDTVFMFDATQAEGRARADSTWIARLFPGPHPVVVVVTDLAWPHVAGVRFWVARGATIVSHRAAETFLHRVVDRRWTMTPDLLETMRAAGHQPRWRFRAVDTELAMAGGEVMVHPIDGITSEIALLGWLPSDRFLWASDYIQTAAERTEYAAEVRAAVRRTGIAPERVAAEHLKLTPWATFDALYPGN